MTVLALLAHVLGIYGVLLAAYTLISAPLLWLTLREAEARGRHLADLEAPGGQP